MANRGFKTGGGVSVDTVVQQPSVHPGGVITGTVSIVGGSKERVVKTVTVALASRVEVESGDREFAGTVVFAGQPVWGSFTLAPGARHAVQFALPVPWEAPLTVLNGNALRGMFVGLQTQVDIARAVDKSDLDQVHIHPLPVQQDILAALTRMGFRLRGADLEQGRIQGSTMPFYQEIEFSAAPMFARHMSELEVTFLAGPTSVDVVLESDNRGGLLRAGGDTYSRFRVEYSAARTIDWQRQLQSVLTEMATRRGWR